MDSVGSSTSCHPFGLPWPVTGVAFWIHELWENKVLYIGFVLVRPEVNVGFNHKCFCSTMFGSSHIYDLKWESSVVYLSFFKIKSLCLAIKEALKVCRFRLCDIRLIWCKGSCLSPGSWMWKVSIGWCISGTDALLCTCGGLFFNSFHSFTIVTTFQSTGNSFLYKGSIC
jgi:hypothetical protein